MDSKKTSNKIILGIVVYFTSVLLPTIFDAILDGFFGGDAFREIKGYFICLSPFLSDRTTSDQIVLLFTVITPVIAILFLYTALNVRKSMLINPLIPKIGFFGGFTLSIVFWLVHFVLVTATSYEYTDGPFLFVPNLLHLTNSIIGLIGLFYSYLSSKRYCSSIAKAHGFDNYKNNITLISIQRIRKSVLEMRPGVEVQVNRIAEVTGVAKNSVVVFLKDLAKDKEIGQFLELEHVFIRASPEDILLEKAFEEWEVKEKEKQGKT